MTLCSTSDTIISNTNLDEAEGQVHFANPLGTCVSYNEHLVKIPKQVFSKLVSELKEV